MHVVKKILLNNFSFHWQTLRPRLKSKAFWGHPGIILTEILMSLCINNIGINNTMAQSKKHKVSWCKPATLTPNHIATSWETFAPHSQSHYIHFSLHAGSGNSTLSKHGCKSQRKSDDIAWRELHHSSYWLWIFSYTGLKCIKVIVLNPNSDHKMIVSAANQQSSYISIISGIYREAKTLKQ